MTYPPPAPTYLGPPKFHGAADNKPIHRVVIHGTVSPCKKGGARAIAAYFRTTVTTPSSAHYVVDPGEVVQVTYDSVEAYHAPPNIHSLGVELCDPQTGKDGRWAYPAHEAMLHHAAELVAQLCAAYGVPVVRVGSAGLLSGRHGICGHVDVSNAWRQTTHTDPGDAFPWPHFMDLVRAADPAPAPVKHYPNADTILAAATKGAALSHGARARTYTKIRDLIRPYTTGGTP
jgi:N-acetyl-anhydromuramyl-L-alanine amidase AmpD